MQRKVMYVPKLQTRLTKKVLHNTAKEVRVQLYGDRRETTIRDPPDLITRPKKRRMESNPSLFHNRNRLPTWI